MIYNYQIFRKYGGKVQPGWIPPRPWPRSGSKRGRPCRQNGELVRRKVPESSENSRNLPESSEKFRILWKSSGQVPESLGKFRKVWKVWKSSGKFGKWVSGGGIMNGAPRNIPAGRQGILGGGPNGGSCGGQSSPGIACEIAWEQICCRAPQPGAGISERRERAGSGIAPARERAVKRR